MVAFVCNSCKVSKFNKLLESNIPRSWRDAATDAGVADDDSDDDVVSVENDEIGPNLDRDVVNLDLDDDADVPFPWHVEMIDHVGDFV